MEMQHIIDKIRNNYLTIILALIFLSVGIFYYFWKNSIENFHILSKYSNNSMGGIIFIICLGLFLVCLYFDNGTRKINMPDIAAIILTIIAVIGMIMYSNVINSLKYSNEPYITGRALVIEKFRRVGKSGTHHTFLLPNGEIIKKSTGLPIFSRINISNCFLIKYRQNKYVMEVHFIENLGYIDEQECLAK